MEPYPVRDAARGGLVVGELDLGPRRCETPSTALPKRRFAMRLVPPRPEPGVEQAVARLDDADVVEQQVRLPVLKPVHLSDDGLVPQSRRAPGAQTRHGRPTPQW